MKVISAAAHYTDLQLFTAQIANHQFCASVMHNVTWTLQFARRQCCIAMPYHSVNCSHHCCSAVTFYERNKILIPAVSLLQSGLTTVDVSNVGMQRYVCVCVCVCIYIHTHTHTHTQREFNYCIITANMLRIIKLNLLLFTTIFFLNLHFNLPNSIVEYFKLKFYFRISVSPDHTRHICHTNL